MIEGLSKENVREILLLGYTDVRSAIMEMIGTSECYICRKEGEGFIMVGGLWYGDDAEFPQLFAMFSNKIRKNFTAMARGSRMFVNYFDKCHDYLCMTVLAEHEFILNWAAWLGFEAVGIVTMGENSYVDFVRCNPNKKNVYDSSLRPAMH